MSNANDFDIRNGVLRSYKGEGGEVIIPDGVTRIEQSAFADSDTITKVVCPETISAIGWGAFQRCKSLQTVELQEGIKVIGYEAFARCSALVNIVLPQSLTELQWGAFHDCTTLMSINIPKGVPKIDWRTFENCESLVHITIQNRDVRIDSDAFNDCVGLKDQNGYFIADGILLDYAGNGGAITVPKNVTRIADNAFSCCHAIDSVTIPDGVKQIGENAFKDCGKMEVILPDSLRKAKSAFSGCSCKVRVNRWTPTVTRLMADCALEEVSSEDYSGFPPIDLLSRAVKMAKDKAWDPTAKNEAAMLTAIKEKADRLYEVAVEDDEKLNFMCSNKLITAKDLDAYLSEAEKMGDPEKTALLLDYQNQLGVESVTKAREKKAKIMEKYEDAMVERNAARESEKGIEGMTFVITGKLSNVWKSRGEVKEYLESYGAKLGASVNIQTDYLVTNDTDSGSEKNRKAKELGAQVISEEDFNDMIGRRYKDAPQVAVPSWLREIPEAAFKGCKSLISVTIPEGVKSIGESAFYGCIHLESIEIPAGITEIEKFTFWGCQSLRSIMIPEGVTRIGISAFNECSSITDLKIPNSIKCIERGNFCDSKGLADDKGFVIVGNILTKYYGNDQEVVIPDGVRKIGANAFYSYSKRNLTKVVIPESVTEIGEGAFLSCDTVSEVILSDNVSRIGQRAFDSAALRRNRNNWDDGIFFIGNALIEANKDCSGSVYLWEKTCCIAAGAFRDCKDIKEIIVPNSVKFIGKGAFSGCEGLKQITIPDAVPTIEPSVFEGCKSLKKLTLPKTTTAIGEAAFYECRSLESITIPDGAASISQAAFAYCSKLKSVEIPQTVNEICIYAFSNCKKLTRVTIPNSVTRIEKDAFEKCPNLTIHAPAGSYAEQYAKENNIPFVAE
jgi:hypothetical protein